ncbi:MAG: hypothetical protein AAGA65_18100 [Actinomycetota bacterium]
MSWLDEIPEPTDHELWAIEADAELLVAELALVEAETALFARPGNATTAAYLRALLDVVDLHDFTDDWPGGTQFDACRPWSDIPATTGVAS